MRKQAFDNGTINIKPVKNTNEKYIAKLDNMKSLLDFYNQKTKIIELLRVTRK